MCCHNAGARYSYEDHVSRTRSYSSTAAVLNGSHVSIQQLGETAFQYRRSAFDISELSR